MVFTKIEFKYNTDESYLKLIVNKSIKSNVRYEIVLLDSCLSINLNWNPSFTTFRKYLH